MKKTRILSLVLALLMLALGLIGCNKDQPTPQETETAAETTTEEAITEAAKIVPVTINGIALTDYTIVYAAKATSGGKTAADHLNRKLGELYNVELPTANKRQDRPEIVIGLGGDDAAFAEAYQAHPTGLIGVSGKKIVLLGANGSALCKLVDALLAKATTVGDDVSISVTDFEFPAIQVDSLKVMSYNILSDLNKEGRPADAREQMVQTILANDVDVLGTQEDNSENRAVFTQLLGNYSSYIGDGGDNYIYWKTDKFNLIKKGYYYLTETPTTRSKYEDSTQYRTLTYVILEVKETGKQFLFVATHLDYRASEATRVKQISALATQIKKINKDGLPVILVGDFNSLPNASNGAVPTFLGRNPEFAITFNVAETKGDIGESLVSQDDFATRYLGVYDYIFISVDNVYTKYYTIVDNVKDGKYPSDHLPVLAHVDLY